MQLPTFFRSHNQVSAVFTIFIVVFLFIGIYIAKSNDTHSNFYTPIDKQTLSDMDSSTYTHTVKPAEIKDCAYADAICFENLLASNDRVQILDYETHFNYVELDTIIDGQRVYIAHPSPIPATAEPMQMIIYSHGSGESLDDLDSDSRFMHKLRMIGPYFASHNIAFITPQLHGDNWGSSAALQDIASIEAFLRELAQYDSDNSVYTARHNLIGYSMGGLAALKYPIYAQEESIIDTSSQDENFQIALLAPTTDLSYWTSDKVGLLQHTRIHIWHGSSDVNVPIPYTYGFVAYMERMHHPIDLTVVDGADHWDLHQKVQEDLLKYFKDTGK